MKRRIFAILLSLCLLVGLLPTAVFAEDGDPASTSSGEEGETGTPDSSGETEETTEPTETNEPTEPEPEPECIVAVVGGNQIDLGSCRGTFTGGDLPDLAEFIAVVNKGELPVRLTGWEHNNTGFFANVQPMWEWSIDPDQEVGAVLLKGWGDAAGYGQNSDRITLNFVNVLENGEDGQNVCSVECTFSIYVENGNPLANPDPEETETPVSDGSRPGAGDLSISSSSIDFGNVVKDIENTEAGGPERTITLTNTSGRTLYIDRSWLLLDRSGHLGWESNYQPPHVGWDFFPLEAGESFDITFQIQDTDSDSYPETIRRTFDIKAAFGYRHSESSLGGGDWLDESDTTVFPITVEYTLVEPGEELSLSAQSVDFGTVAAGVEPESKTVTITNNGDSVVYLNYGGIKESTSNFYVNLSLSSIEPLAPGESCTLTVDFNVGIKGPGTYENTFVLTTDQGAEFNIPLRAVIGQTTDITITPNSMDFGSQPEGYSEVPGQKVTVTNNNEAPIFVTPARSDSFIVYADNPYANLSSAYGMSYLDPGESTTFTVTPHLWLKNGTYTDTLTFKIRMFNVQEGENDIPAEDTVQARFVVGDGSGTGLPFTDVKSGDWFCDSVRYVYENELMSGTGTTTFGPNEKTTRGMIVTILYRLENEPSVSADSAFSDVEAGQYYANAVAWANQNGIVTGYDDGRFGPNDTITREQMAAILYRYADYKEQDVSAAADLSAFTDAGSVSDYAVQAFEWAVSEGLITGSTDTTLSPAGSALRCEVATILMRFLQQ
ncbi:MAG TPA: S-layer homology domain-containing protein [Candidatus Ventrousia excrementavium]|uniref:S-layer homology domain-containing protein n=1 Tax=Candidatus Ventrousia excrementavium TaxID=2840961 RepID=A0A9D1IWD0_9CLOT|nr:S-layer homology domain-containing protein [Candidatus Ventrousia excrementavium]